MSHKRGNMATPNLTLFPRSRKPRPNDAEAWRRLCQAMTAAKGRVLLEQALRRGPCRCVPAEGFPWPV